MDGNHTHRVEGMGHHTQNGWCRQQHSVCDCSLLYGVAVMPLTSCSSLPLTSGEYTFSNSEGCTYFLFRLMNYALSYKFKKCQIWFSKGETRLLPPFLNLPLVAGWATCCIVAPKCIIVINLYSKFLFHPIILKLTLTYMRTSPMYPG